MVSSWFGQSCITSSPPEGLPLTVVVILDHSHGKKELVEMGPGQLSYAHGRGFDCTIRSSNKRLDQLGDRPFSTHPVRPYSSIIPDLPPFTRIFLASGITSFRLPGSLWQVIYPSQRT